MTTVSEQLLEIGDLRVEYHTDEGVVTAVEDLELHLDKGQTLGLVGETGAGKTTTALSIMRLVPDPPGRIVSGSVLFHGEDLLQKRSDDIKRIRGQATLALRDSPV